MTITPLDSAASWLKWSNVVYVGGAALTLVAAMLVFIEKRLVATGRLQRTLLFTEWVIIGAAIVSLIGTIGAIHFGNVVSGLKDAALAQYEKAADVKIAQAQKDTADANQEAQRAGLEAQQTNQENVQLKLELQKHEKQSATTEAQLAHQSKENYDFAHALAQQQQNMAEQAKVSPILDRLQIADLAGFLKPFAGQAIQIHSTPDTVVIRLLNGIKAALAQARITPSASLDFGQTYQGVSVVIHNPQDVPPLANALVMGLRREGIEVHPVALASVPPGQVFIYLGPN